MLTLRAWIRRRRVRMQFGVAVAAVSLLLLMAAGCGSGSMNSNIGGSTAQNLQVRIGDAPADRVIAFEATVGPITLTPASGAPVTILSSPRRIEVSHLSGTSEPLAIANVPGGTYVSASVTVSQPEVTFINSSGQTVELQPAFNQNVTVSF